MTPSIPPGQEDLVADMLGKASALPGGCVWTGASIERANVTARYTCSAGDVVLELGPADPASSALARTAQFGITQKRGPASPALVEAVAGRVRAREASFLWVAPKAPEAPPERPSWVGPTLALAGAAGVLGVMSYLLLRRMLGVARATGASSGASVGPFAASMVAAAVSCGALLGWLRALGAAARALLLRESPIRAVIAALACALVGVCAAVALGRLATRAAALRRFAVIAMLGGGLGFALSLPRSPLHFFGPLSTYAPSTVAVELSPRLPRVTYRTNQHGFRGPEWALEKAPGAARIVVLGDSFVFGYGVEHEDTLTARLAADLAARWPARRVEVLNLGIPGDNLASHVDAHAASLRLDPDVVVLCLTLPNDLSRWDGQIERREARRPSVYAFARFLLGDAASTIWGHALLDVTVTREGMDHMDRELARLADLRRSSPRRPRLFVFPFGQPDALEERLPAAVRAIDEATLIPTIPWREEYSFPGDGHPNAAGNQRFAAAIAGALAGDEAARRALGVVGERAPVSAP